MKKLFLTVITSASIASWAVAQDKTDTVIVELAKTSKVIFTMQSKEDLETLRHYDFQQLFKDILLQLESKDSSLTAADTNTADNQTERHQESEHGDDDKDTTKCHDNHEWKWHHKHKRWGSTWQLVNFDLGINNYIDNGNSPAQDNSNYVVRPWGSWTIAINSIQRSRLGKKIFLEWGVGVNWYNFKFENNKTLINKTDDAVLFESDTRDYEFIKSKLTVTYVNASLIPVFDIGEGNHDNKKWKGNSAFRIGIGPYAGYRIASHSKQEYRENGEREKDKNKDNFYLNNFRYGARLQVGLRSTDLFFNYDINNLFIEGKGPDLNAFSFGVIF